MKFFWSGLLVFLFFSAQAQDSLSAPSSQTFFSSFIIDSIRVEGNRKTKDAIIIREMPFAVGDTLAADDLPKKLRLAEQQITNTSLFIEVTVGFNLTDSNHVTIQADVKERWYFLPIPYFRLVDRNFNQWWTEHRRSLNRVNYGLKLIQNNVSGRNDNAYLWLINGYNHQIAARYDIPFIDKRLHHGISIAASYLKQRELNYGTTPDNKQLFYKGNDFVRQQFRAEASYLYRPAIRTWHSVTFRFTDEKLADTILKLNPNYFPYSRNHISYPTITYTLRYSNADNLIYPTKGFIGDFSLIKKGLGKVMNLWQLNYHLKQTMRLRPKTQLQLQSAGVLSVPFKQAFFNRQLVNYYGDIFFRGLEYYVVDGVAATINRATLRQHLFTYNLKNPVNTAAHNNIPVRFYLKLYGDAGYVYDNRKESRLANSFLGTYGVGLDIVTIYDVVLRLEYSFNQWNEHNLYIHSKGDF